MKRIDTFSDLLEYLVATDLPNRQTAKILAQDVRQFCFLAGREPNGLVTNANAISAVARGIDLAQAGISRKRLQNILSSVRTALRLAGALPGRSPYVLDDNWKDLLVKAGTGPFAEHKENALRPLGAYCSRHGILPNQVDAAVIEEYARERKATTTDLRHGRYRRDARSAWNWLVRILPDQRLQSLDRINQRTVSLPDSDLPASLRQEIDAYVRQLGLRWANSGPEGTGSHDLDLLAWASTALASARVDQRGRQRLPRPLSSATASSHAHVLRRTASILTSAGRGTPTTIGECTTPAAISIMASREAKRGVAARTISSQAAQLYDISRRWVDRSEIEDKEIRSMLSYLRSKIPPGMAQVPRERLAKIANSEATIQLRDLPDRLVELARRHKRPKGIQAALLMQVAVAVRLLLVVPIRRRTLASINVETSLQLPTRRNATGLLTIEGAQTKTGEPIVAELDIDTVKLLRLYLRWYRKRLSDGAETEMLFPGQRPGTAKTPGQLGRLITRHIRAQTGLTVNPHLFRHLGATLVFDQSDGNTQAVQALLGHSSRGDTWKSYTQVSQTWAGRKLQDALASAGQKRTRRRTARRTARRLPAERQT